MSHSTQKLLAKAGRFSEEESFLLKQELQLKTIQKDEFFLKKDEVCSSLAFVNLGGFYHYKLDRELKKTIIELNTCSDWVINYESFASRKPSKYAIKAFKDTSIYELSIEAIHRLIGQSQAFFQLGRILEASTSRLHFFDNHHTPDQKYNYLLKNRPELLQQFPQKMIASYLKITPETLSRVRKRSLKN